MYFINLEPNLTCIPRIIDTTVYDGDDFSSTAVTRVVLNCLNDLPQLSLDAGVSDINVSFTEGSTVPTQLYSSIDLRDIDSVNLQYAEITVIDKVQTNEGMQIRLISF